MERVKNKNGITLIASLIFLAVFTTWILSVGSSSSVNLQLARNQHKIGTALSAAESGLEHGRFVISSYTPITTWDGQDVTQVQADTTWDLLCRHFRDSLNGQVLLGGRVIGDAGRFTDSFDSGDELVTPVISTGRTSFQLRLYRYDSNPFIIKLQSIGSDSEVTRKACIDLAVEKDTTVLKYAVASRSRIIITGDSTIEGDIYSPWDLPNIASPFEVDANSVINGTLNTVIDRHSFDPDSGEYVGYTLETLDEDGNAIFDANGNRIYSSDDMVQGYHEGINYGQPDIPASGFEASDYDTSSYDALTEYVSTGGCSTVIEYFPHAPGDFTQRQDWSSRRLTRPIIENQVITNGKLAAGSNALFRNCTFEDILYVEGADSIFNNVRFEDCTFNGAIVTDVPADFYWQKNVLYFTGTAIFDNRYMEEATILAPNFNVNIGNTMELEDDSESVLTGLVVGGIVDVRGNANVNGTILSMYDPGPLGASAALYGTNVGFSDENNEAGIPEDVGTIHINPDPEGLMPLGVRSDVILVPLPHTYSEM